MTLKENEKVVQFPLDQRLLSVISLTIFYINVSLYSTFVQKLHMID